jgi:hypothetical protein
MALTKVDPTVVDDQVFGNRNVIINGEMQIAQRGTQTGMGAATAYSAVDRMNIAFNQTSGRLTSEQSTDTPDGFTNSLKLSCTTADTSLANTEYVVLQQKIEGYNLQRFAKGTSSAKEFTVSFYVKGNASATYNLELYDLDNTRQINKQFSVTTSWNRIELTFPADTTGAFDEDANASLVAQIWLTAGSSFQGTTANTTWQSVTDNTKRANGSSNFLSSTSNTFFITGFQLETGSQATPFEHRSHAEQLTMCQRYYQVMVDGNHNRYWTLAVVYTTNQIIFNIPTTVQMRATPTLENSSWGANIYRDAALLGNTTTLAGNLHDVRRMGIFSYLAQNTGVQGNPCHVDWTGGGLALTAEL